MVQENDRTIAAISLFSRYYKHYAADEKLYFTVDVWIIRVKQQSAFNEKENPKNKIVVTLLESCLEEQNAILRMKDQNSMARPAMSGAVRKYLLEKWTDVMKS